MLRQIAFLNMMLLFNAISAIAEPNGVIKGTILDKDTKEPLVAANLVLVGTNYGALSDTDGKFSIEAVSVGTYSLQATYLGYDSYVMTDVVVKAAKPTLITIELHPSPIQFGEVTVSAGYFNKETEIQPSTISLSREEIRRFPGGFEDVVRTVSTLPGVSINMTEGRNDLLVRGGGPSENLYLIDGIEVPNINHFGTQGNSGGSLSFVNLDFVDDVVFSTGGFTARYGDKLSSVLELSMIKDFPQQFESKTTISATQYGIDFEVPIADRGGVIFSARKSYLDLIFKANGLPFVPVYTDFNVLLNYNISPKDKLFLVGLSAINNVDRDLTTLENRVFNAGLMDNTQYKGITGLSYRRLLKSGYLDLMLSVNLARYEFKQTDENLDEYFSSEADEWEYTAKLQHFWALNKQINMISGISTRTIPYYNHTIFADTIFDRSGNKVSRTSLGLPAESDIDIVGRKHAAYLELEYQVLPSVKFNTGLRFDYFPFIDNPVYLAPRLLVRYQPTPKVTYRASTGVYYQAPSYVWVTNPNNKALVALRNDMSVLGWDYQIRDDARLSLEGYYKAYSDLPTGTIPGLNDYLVLTNTGTSYGGRQDDFQSFGYFDLESKGFGNAYGVELLVQKKLSQTPFFGLASLAYSKSQFVANNGIEYPGQYDQRFILNLSGGYLFSNKWQLTSKFRYFTGIPYTPVYIPSTNNGNIQNLPDEYLSEILDPGHQLDVRIDRFFNFRSSTLTVYLDIQNIYNFKYPMKPQYDFWEDKIADRADIAILPSIGISYEY